MAKKITFELSIMASSTKCIKCRTWIGFTVPNSGYVNNFTCPSCNQEYAAFRKIGGYPMLVLVETENSAPDLTEAKENKVDFNTDLMEYSTDDRIRQLEKLLLKAEQQEKYENAAKIRDEINKYKNPGK